MIPLLALLIGIVAGLRAMTAPAVVSWAAHLGWIPLTHDGLVWLAHPWAHRILTALAVAELIADQRPSTPSRTVPVQFGTRILAGALCGAALCGDQWTLLIGAVAGAAGAVIGTLGGRAARARLAGAFNSDRPAALIEDAVAIAGAILIVRMIP
ncbi:Uncharacterized membrane protein [Azospirillum lipoferum]|uniref:DUF4126 family protein n=1 Tax=Azospirillum agricola TaxID=1720247 RepID=UPI000A0F34BF|nr:DUF4126 family protein [Azospirillum agricola]SMH46770.1 Uncharacterized membrane protein [Azospirillum lipoferum]